MKKKSKLSFLLCALLTSHAASAAIVNGKILNVGFHLHNRASLDYNQEGVAQITVAGLPPACGNGEGRVVISTNNPLYSSIVSAALAAQARGVIVTVNYFETCSVRTGSWDLGVLEVPSP